MRLMWGCVVVLLVYIPATYSHGIRFDSTDFKKADSIAARYYGHSLKELRVLSEKLTLALPTEKEKFRAIYRWVCDNIDSDHELNKKNQRMRARLKDDDALMVWNRKVNKQAFRNLVEQRKTVCTGYAYLVRELALHAGLECRIIDGYGRTVQANIGGTGVPNHSWNAVRLDGRWYLCDATWSSGAYDVTNSVFIRNFNEGYFLADPALFVHNHYPLDTSWMLLRDKPRLHDFLNGPLIYPHTFGYGVKPVLPVTFDVAVKKGEDVAFQFVQREGKDIGTVNWLIGNRDLQSKTVFEKQTRGDGMIHYAVQKRFYQKGVYIVHCLLSSNPESSSGDYVFAYRVTVR